MKDCWFLGRLRCSACSSPFRVGKERLGSCWRCSFFSMESGHPQHERETRVFSTSAESVHTLPPNRGLSGGRFPFKRIQGDSKEVRSINRATSWSNYSIDERRGTLGLRRSVSLSCLEGLPRRLCWRELALLLWDPAARPAWIDHTHSFPNELHCRGTLNKLTIEAPASFLLHWQPHLGETLFLVLLDEMAHELGRVALLQQPWRLTHLQTGLIKDDQEHAPAGTLLSRSLKALDSASSSRNAPNRPELRAAAERPLKRSNSMDSLHGCRREASQSQSVRQEALHRFRQLLTLQRMEPPTSAVPDTPRTSTEATQTIPDEDEKSIRGSIDSNGARKSSTEAEETSIYRLQAVGPAPEKSAAQQPQRDRRMSAGSSMCAGRAESVDLLCLQTPFMISGDDTERRVTAKPEAKASTLLGSWQQRWARIWQRRAPAPSVTTRTITRSIVYCLYESLCFWGHRDLGRTVKLASEALLDELIPPGKLSCRRKILEYLIPCGCGSYVLWYLQRRRIISGKPALYQMPQFHWTHLRTWRSAAFTISYRMMRLAVIYRFFLKFGTPLYRLATLLALVLSFFRAEVLSDLFRVDRWPRYLSFGQGMRTVLRSVVYAAAFSIPLERYGRVFAVSRRRANVRKAIFFGTVMVSGRIRSALQLVRETFRKGPINSSRFLAPYGVALS